VGKGARSLGNLFMFRESENSLKEIPGDSFFVYPYRSKKEIKFYPNSFSCIYEHVQEKRLISVCPQLDS
jgi:hypothetical protein